MGAQDAQPLFPAPRAVYWYNGFKAFVRLRSGRPTIGPLLNLVVASAAGLMTEGFRGSQGTPSHPLPDPGALPGLTKPH